MKKFQQLLAVVLILGMLGTIALVAYTVHCHNNCSIITYISNEE